MDKILITGVAGFIGSNLANHLLEKENNIVYGIDNFSSSTMSNLYPLLKNPNFHFIEQDVEKKIELYADHIYHFAGCGDLKHYHSDNYGFIMKNIKIIENILTFCQENGAKLILPTMHEDKHEINSKLFRYYSYLKFIEDITFDLIEKNKINAKFVRLSDIYGEGIPKQSDNFIHKLFLSILKNEKISLEYDTAHYFTYIKDVCNLLEKIMNTYTDKNIIDIINPNLYLKSDLIKLIINYSKSNSQIELLSNIQYNPSYKPNEYISEHGISYTCKTRVLEGIAKTVEYYKLMYLS